MKTTTRAVLPAYLIAGVALFVALGGPAEARALITGAGIKDGTVTTADIKNGSLTGTDVRDGSLTGADTKDGSLASADVKDGSVTGADVKDGSLGAADLAPAVTNALTTSACSAGQVLKWVTVPVERDSDSSLLASDTSFKLGRCYESAPGFMGDGKLQEPEQCDDGNLVSGDGCDSTGHWEAVRLRVTLN